MRFRNLGTGSRVVAAIAAAVLVAGTGLAVARVARASDHQDNPLVELNPAMDMTDVYAFPGATADRTVLVLNSWAFLTPAQSSTVSFDPNLLYQFKIDNTGDAKEDRVIQITFSGTGSSQQVSVRGPFVPPVVGAMNNQVGSAAPVVTGAINTVLGSSSSMQVFAGVREDPFFFDLSQFYNIVPDRHAGSTAATCLPGGSGTCPGGFNAVGTDFFNNSNVLSIVVEMPKSDLTGNANNLVAYWATTSTQTGN